MRYSLLSRFTGGILGSCLGDYLYRQQPGQLGKPQISPWHAIALSGCERLSDRKSFDWQDWQERPPDLDALAQSSSHAQALTVEFAIAMLPLILFFHDQTALLKQSLTRLAQTWLPQQVKLEELWIWIDCITLTLKDKLSLASPLIPPSSGQLGQEIARIPQYLQNFTPLPQVTAQITHPFALALYCFWGSRDQFRLSLLRSRQIGDLNVMLLVGTLSGLYNTESGIPLDWCFHYARPSAHHESKRLAQGLFAAWSGVYAPPSSWELQQSAIAPPGIIQARRALRIISQQE